jgi:predicted nuclease with TOPRIM domain
MRDYNVKQKLEDVQAEIETRKVQLREIRLSYDIARDRLSRVEKQLRILEEQYDLLASGQLPLPMTYDDYADLDQ